MSWDPQQYLKFAQPRLRPALDLLARVDLAQPRQVHDLGCGTGTVTRLMAERWPQAQICGVDDSATMLAQAGQTPSRVVWQHCHLAQWHPAEPAELIYSNAALHWLPDHQRLFPALMSRLAPGGVLAVQMPRNFHAPSHTAVAQTVADGPWASVLAPLLKPVPVSEPATYFDWLDPHAASLEIWETEYLQILSGPDAVKEWTKGTWLKPFLDALIPPDRDAFEQAYARRVAIAYPMREDGRTLFPFRRLFILARRR